MKKQISFFGRGAALPVVLAFAMSLLVCGSSVHAADLSTGQWRLWVDQKATWQNDKLYLPDEVNLAALPVNPPTGGWGILDEKHGIAVTLPATVEQFYWDGLPGAVSDARKQTPTEIVEHDGTYHGVSWWYRHFDGPTLRDAQRLILSVRGSRLRAEVYVNGKLCGYNIITELPFTADVTDAAHPGDNLLAIRITNPGGNITWQDDDTFKWGSYELPLSHGFGGIDAGVLLDVRAGASVKDFYVLNTGDPRTVTLNAEIASTGPAFDGPVDLAIGRKGQVVWRGSLDVHLAAKLNGSIVLSKTVTLPGAQLWELDSPALYSASASLRGVEHSERSTTFGFRSFTATGIGSDAKLMLNGRRIVVRSSISWGFWGPNGMFPTDAQADKEAAAARALGLNCVQNHRHMPKPAVLDAYDRAGMMRYCEPGAGRFTITPFKEQDGTGPIDISGRGGELTSFTNKYELAKVLGMIRYNRSHPSVIMWCLQNEMQPDLHDPRIFYVLRQMREADPSRIILLHSGDNSGREVWLLPYSDQFMIDDAKTSAGWIDQHTAMRGMDVYQDGSYQSPEKYAYHTDNVKAISMWGEMATSASADDHAKIVRDYEAAGATGYDRSAHEAILAAYDHFLDAYGFRGAFPQSESLFNQIGDRHYLMDARMMEDARICDANDYIVLSGFESTVRDNHSGMLDAERNFKGDPTIVGRAGAPELLVIRSPHFVLAKGDTASVDVHLINEHDLHGNYSLTVAAADAAGKPISSATIDVDVKGGDVYGQLLAQKLTFKTTQAGTVLVTATLTDPLTEKTVLTRSEHLFVVDVNPSPLRCSVSLIDPDKSAAGPLHAVYGINAVPLTAAANPDVIVIHCPITMRGKAESIFLPMFKSSGFDWAAAFAQALPHVKDHGARLVLLAGSRDVVDAAAELGKLGAIHYRDHVGPSGPNWFGSWYFVRKHWLFDGLPSDCVMDWQYQVSGNDGDGLLMDAPGMEAVAGYGRDHRPTVGVGAATIPYGRGEIVLLCLPGFETAVCAGDSSFIHADAARRIFYNALRGKTQ